MFQFPGFASHTYEFSVGYPLLGGFPHSEILGSKPARGSPKLIATCYVLHRLSVPRHPPDALLTLDLLKPIWRVPARRGQAPTHEINPNQPKTRLQLRRPDFVFRPLGKRKGTPSRRFHIWSLQTLFTMSNIPLEAGSNPSAPRLNSVSP